jgi:transcriptional regulator with XRE-family HTH domain
MTVETFGKIIREQRKAKNMTLADLAAHCNVGIRFLSELEHGKPTIEIGKAFKVMQRLNIELNVTPTAEVQKSTYNIPSE